MKLSIIVPVYNEKHTLKKVICALQKVSIPHVSKEIIIVDDGSYDGTKEIIKKLHGKALKKFFHKKNKGKGAAVKKGISHAEGDYILIQDADLEYNPSFIKNLVIPIQRKKAEVVYGTRLKRLPHLSGEEKKFRFFLHYIGNRFLSLITSLLYGQWITDMETCYKLIPYSALQKMVLHAKGFDIEPEITAKLCKAGYSIFEVPIKTEPRGYEEGKKLNTVRDGIKALVALVKYRFID